MKKILSIMVLMLFLFSLAPLALAQDDNGTDTGVDTETSTGTDTEIEIEIEERDGETRTRVRERVRDARDDLEESRERLRAAREDVIKARDRHQLAQENYLDEVRNFRDARRELRRCQGDDSESCEDLRREVKGKSLDHLLRTADKIQNMIDKLQDRIEDSNIEGKEDLLADLEASEADLEALIERIEGLEDPSAEEIRNIAAELREIWNNTKKDLRVGIAKSANYGVHGVIVRAEKLEEKLQRTLDRLEADGQDTSPAEEFVTSFGEHVATAKDLAAQAEEKFAEADTVGEEDRNALLREGHQLLKDARAELRLAHEDLKKAVRAIKGIEGGEDTLDEETESVEHDAQEALGEDHDSDDGDSESDADSDDESDDDSESDADSDDESDDESDDDSEEDDTTA